MKLTGKIDAIEKIILDFDASFSEDIIKSTLLLIKYFNNNDLSSDNQISNVEIINLDELSTKDQTEKQEEYIENLIVSSIPQEDLAFSLFAVCFEDSWSSFVIYTDESKIYAKYNDSSGNIIPDLLEKVLNDLQSNGIIDAWEDCQTTIPGGRSNDSGPKTIRNLLEMVYKPDSPLQVLEMPLKYYEILRLSYVICHVFIKMLDTLEIRAYLSDLLQTTHNLSDIEHKIDWLEELIKDVCLCIKDNNPSPDFARVLNNCEEALKNLSITPGARDQDPIPYNMKERTITDINLIYTQTFSKMENIDLEEKQDHNSLGSNDLDNSISPLKFDSSDNLNNILTARTMSEDFTRSHTDFSSAIAQMKTKSASFDATTGRIPPFGPKITPSKSLTKVIMTKAIRIKGSSNKLKEDDIALDKQSIITTFSESEPKNLKKDTLSALEMSQTLFDESFKQSTDLNDLTQSVNLSKINPLFAQTIDDSSYQDGGDMLRTVNLESTLRENYQSNLEEDSNFKPLTGEASSVCKTH